MTIEEKRAILQKQLIEYCNEKVGREKVGGYEYGRGYKKVDFRKRFLQITIKKSGRKIFVKSYKQLSSVVETIDDFVFEDNDKIGIILHVIKKEEVK